MKIYLSKIKLILFILFFLSFNYINLKAINISEISSKDGENDTHRLNKIN